MMQSLLADHFKLVVHRESQEADVYALTLSPCLRAAGAIRSAKTDRLIV